MDGEEAVLRLGVVEEDRGDQGLVVGETEKLLVGDVGGEAGGLEEVGGGKVLAVGDVDAENGVVERALRVREEKGRRAVRRECGCCSDRRCGTTTGGLGEATASGTPCCAAASGRCTRASRCTPSGCPCSPP